MTRKQWTLIGLAIFLAALSLYLNRDWFARDAIQIFHRSRPARPGSFNRKQPDVAPAVNPIFFGFDRKLKLTSIKVVSLREFETNKYTVPIWHMVSDSNSVPTKEFSYGAAIKGMRPDVNGATAGELQPGENYRLLIEAGTLKAQHDFTPVPRAP